MGVQPLNTSGSATVSAGGTATVVLGPNVGQRWNLSIASILTSTSVSIPVCKIYMGGGVTPIDGNFVDGTYTGNLNSTDAVSGIPLSNGQKIIAVWSGADVGARATLSIMGTVTT